MSQTASRRRVRLTPGWWRTNRAGVIATAGLAVATIATIGGAEWFDQFWYRPSLPITVPAGETVEFAGATWGPAAGTVLEGQELDVPDGARAVAVSLPVQPGESAVGCMPPTLREVGGLQREWEEDGFGIGVPYDVEVNTSCALTGPSGFEIDAVYLVPVDAGDTFWLEVVYLPPADAEESSGDGVAPSQLPRFLRLELVVDGA